MTQEFPNCCNPDAIRLLAGQVDTINSPDALFQAACAVAMHENPCLDINKVDRQIQAMADQIRRRVKGRQPQGLMAHMHEYLFEELKFKGNVSDFYNPTNNYLSNVIESRLGLPITLSMVYKMVAQRLGLRSWGVGLPGHFLAGIEVEGVSMLVDPYAGGRLLTTDEARERMEEIFGGSVEWSEEMLRPASNRHWLTRMLQNLLIIFGSHGRYHDVAAMLEMEIVLWPEQSRLQRDLALVLARVGMSHPASLWLNRYLQSNPDDPQTDDLKQLLEVLAA
jgi:regulator of sirC expression with transglutaminase-like and TPR domain